MAKSLKALVDYIYINKIDFDSVDFLLNSLRIEKEELNQFLSKIKKELNK